MERDARTVNGNSAVQPIFIGRPTAVAEAKPTPPFMIHTRNFFYLGVRYDPAAARAALPDGLHPLEDCSGVIGVYTAPEGWGLAPLCCTFFGISVSEQVAPDGSPTVFMAEQIVGDQGEAIYHDSYNQRVRHGVTHTSRDGDTAIGDMQSEAGLELEIKAFPRFEETYSPTSGLHYYMGEAEGGGVNIFSVAFTARFIPADILRFKIFDSASARLKSLKPVHVDWAMFLDTVPLTFSAPSLYSPSTHADYSASAQQVGLMDLLSRIGHAAALVSREGRTLFLTPEAQRMLSNVQVGGKLAVWRQVDQQALDAELSTLGTNGRLVSSPVAIERPDGGLPVVAKALPVSSALAGEPAILILFSDPANAAVPEAHALLQVIGLTPAEARLAATVASGNALRACAEQLNVTENTARSTLKIVYDKLGISKQSELAGIVARMG